MERTITVKADSVEEAVHLALSILDVEADEIKTEVLSSPGRSLFGLRKSLAEVRVTAISANKDQIKEDSTLEDLVETVGHLPIKENKKKVAEIKEKETSKGARIINQQIELKFSKDFYPILYPKENVSLWINGEIVKGKQIIKQDDQVELKITDELNPPSYSIKVTDRDMSARLSFIPGKKIYRTIANTDYEEELVIEAEEHIEYYNDVRPQQMISRLKELGIQSGYVFQAIQSITEALEEKEEIVAEGIHPTDGLDGDFVLLIEDEVEIGELEAVDFRELNQLQTVRAGEIIGTQILSEAGQDGVNVYGDVIPAKPVKDIVVRTGKNVELIGNDVVAKTSGKPSLNWRGRHVRIDVHHEFVHMGDVDLESGNIRFEGDVSIKGNIHATMFVGASGNIRIDGTVTKAMIQSASSVVVTKNVFTTTINVGKQNFVIGELAAHLSEITMYLERIHDAISQVMLIRERQNEQLSPAELNQFIHLLLEKKYMPFKKLLKDFIQQVKNHSLDIDEEWKELADQFYDLFIRNLAGELYGEVVLERLIEESSELIELYLIEPEPKSLLSIPYAINSVLYCSGNIEITSKGLYHSFVTGKHNVYVKGVVRGGEIHAGNIVKVDECGSKNNVKTAIYTEEKGRIYIQIAHEGTEIYVGNRKHLFTKKRTDVHAYVNEEGQLVID